MGGGDKLTGSSSSSPSLMLEVKCDYMKTPTSPSEVTLMARLTASAQREGERRAPVTICAAIDRSSSMKDHLPLLKETLRFMIQQLQKEDKLCLVTFDHEVRVDLPLTCMDADGKIKAIQAIDRVQERGQTNLSGGLLAALQTLYRIKSSDASLVESVLLFTDGKANRGIVDQAILVKSTKSLLEQINRQACVFTFGYGTEHDANLLHAISEAGHGLFYYIDSPDSIPESFCDCLGGLLSVAAQNVKLTFSACEGTSMSPPKTTYKVVENKIHKSYQVTIHDMYCEEERCILATVFLPADQALSEPTSVPIATCKLEFFDVILSKQSESKGDLSIVRNKKLERPIPSDDHDDIELHRIRCEVASTMSEANTLAGTGNIPAAKEKLCHARKRVKGSCVATRPLAVHLVDTVDESLEGLEDKLTYTEHGRAVMRNYADSHWQQRSNAVPSKVRYMKAKMSKDKKGGAIVPPPPPPPLPASPGSKNLTSPYRNFSKNLIVARHSSSIASSKSAPSTMLTKSTMPTKATPMEATPMEAPIKATPTEMPIKATPTETPIKGTPTDMPIKATPTEMPIKATPTETPIKATPMD